MGTNYTFFAFFPNDKTNKGKKSYTPKNLINTFLYEISVMQCFYFERVYICKTIIYE